MPVSIYDPNVILNRIISNLKLDTSIYDEKGVDGKIHTILFGEPISQNWLNQERPYITVAPGEPFEISDEPLYVAKLGEESPKSIITLQFFITCIVDGESVENGLGIDFAFRILLKKFFKDNPKMKNTADNSNPLFHRSRTIITPKFLRNKSDIISAFTVILQADIPSS